MSDRICSVTDCAGAHIARGMCNIHYRRWKKYGDPLTTAYDRRFQHLSPEETLGFLRGPATATGCVEWTGYVSAQGYGQLMRNGAKLSAHRLAYEQAFGPIPEGRVIRHSCDNPPCVNPDHLSLGDRGDNARDAVARRRHKAGIAHHAAKMTDEKVRELRRMRDAGMTYQGLADHFGLSFSQARAIARREAWKRVA